MKNSDNKKIIDNINSIIKEYKNEKEQNKKKIKEMETNLKLIKEKNFKKIQEKKLKLQKSINNLGSSINEIISNKNKKNLSVEKCEQLLRNLKKQIDNL